MPVVTIKPSDGGQLITRPAQSEAGPANYTIKRNWRRDLDAEVWREGYAPFQVDPAAGDADLQARPTTSPIKLVTSCLWPDGTTTFIAGSATTIWELSTPSTYWESGYEVGGYAATISRWNPIATGLSNSGRRWQAKMVNGRLWLNNGVDLPLVYERTEGIAKPCYELRDQGVVSSGIITEFFGVPMCLGISELSIGGLDSVTGLISSSPATVAQAGAKESGQSAATLTVAYGGLSGVANTTVPLFAIGDIGSEIQFYGGQRAVITIYSSPTQVTVVPVGSSTLTAIPAPGQRCRVTAQFNPASPVADSWSIIASAPFFTAEMVGSKITIGDQIRTIVAFASSTHAKVDSDQPAAAATALVDNPKAYGRLDQMVAPTPSVDERADRALWGNNGNPNDFAAAINVDAVAGGFTLTTTRSAKSFSVGDEVVLVGGGLDGGNLSVDSQGNPVVIASIGPGIVRLSTPAQTAGKLQLFHAASIGSIVGYEDLEDAGGAIIAAGQVGDNLVVHKDNSAFIGSYTGASEKPFIFQPVEIPHGRSVHYRNSIASINGEIHVYPGRTALWMFDPIARKVKPLPSADLVEDRFFATATIEATESLFVADNTVTQELWFFTADPADPVLAYDYRWSTFSTADFGGVRLSNGVANTPPTITAAASVVSPTAAKNSETETWFVMGTSDGRLVTYGAVTGAQNSQPAWSKRIYYRQPTTDATTASTYDCVIASGLSNFGDEMNQKAADRYMVQFGAPPSGSPEITVRWFGANSQAVGSQLLGTRTISAVQSHGMVPVHFLAHNLQDHITSRPPAGNPTSPLRLLYRAWDFLVAPNKSHGRR